MRNYGMYLPVRRLQIQIQAIIQQEIRVIICQTRTSWITDNSIEYIQTLSNTPEYSVSVDNCKNYRG